MLIARKPKQGDIVTFRISSGEEIVGKMASDTNISINKPVLLVSQMVGPNQAQLGFMPFLAAAEDEVTITFEPHGVITQPTPAKKDVRDGYISATSSIVAPTAQQAGLILGG
jgi:hypothetical protein